MGCFHGNFFSVSYLSHQSTEIFLKSFSLRTTLLDLIFCVIILVLQIRKVDPTVDMTADVADDYLSLPVLC